jgi:hypothetical protein
MKRSIRKCFGMGALSLLLLLAAGVSALAKNSGTVALTHDVVLSGTTLSAGKYVVRWEAQSARTTVEFARGHKAILSTEGRIEDRGKKYPSNMVVYDTAADGSSTIGEIRFAGSSEVLLFNQ